MDLAKMLSSLSIHQPVDRGSVVIDCGYGLDYELELQNVSVYENYQIRPVAPGEPLEEAQVEGLVVALAILITHKLPDPVEEEKEES